jgi:hypothetical protein
MQSAGLSPKRLLLIAALAILALCLGAFIENTGLGEPGWQWTLRVIGDPGLSHRSHRIDPARGADVSPMRLVPWIVVVLAGVLVLSQTGPSRSPWVPSGSAVAVRGAAPQGGKPTSDESWTEAL